MDAFATTPEEEADLPVPAPGYQRPNKGALNASEKRKLLAIMRKNGCSPNAARVALGIPTGTFQRGKELDPNFSKAIDANKGRQLCQVEGAVFRGATVPDKNGRIDGALAQFWLANRDPENWKPLTKIEVNATAAAAAMATPDALAKELDPGAREALVLAGSRAILEIEE